MASTVGAFRPPHRSDRPRQSQANCRCRRTYDVSVGETNLAWETLLDLAGPSTAPSTAPLHVRLAGAIRTAIRRGRVPLGAALPPSRTLAAELHVSRWTV